MEESTGICNAALFVIVHHKKVINNKDCEEFNTGYESCNV